MALNAYLTLRGDQQGEIQGSSTQKGREGRIIVIAANHELVSPRDPASGLPSGQRRHQPFVITKELDRSSPLLYQALVHGENFSHWELQFWTPRPRAAAGVEQQHYTVRLVDASIANIGFKMANNRHPDLAPLVEYEEIAFTYRRIRWTWNDGGVTAEDDWNALGA